MNNIIKLSLLILLLLVNVQSIGNGTSCQVQDCQQCSDPTFCDVCSGILKPSSDQTMCLECDVAHCTYCSQDNSCEICQVGYKLWVNPGINSTMGEGNLCFLCNLAMCDICNADNKCQKCLQGYTLTTDGTCKNCQYPCAECFAHDLTCFTCQPPFFIKPDANGTCFQATIPFCVEYDPMDTSVCLTCQLFFNLNKTTNVCKPNCIYPCVECTGLVCNTCIDRYYAFLGFCLPCPFGCLSCTNATNCLMAANGFYLNGTIAVFCPSFCATCSSATVCLTYHTNYIGFLAFFFNGQFSLAPCPWGCNSCSFLNFLTCLIPKPGFFIFKGQIAQCSSTCKTCSTSDANVCLSCYTNSFFKNGQCISCDSSCLTCQGADSPSTCLSCADGSYLDGTACVKGCPLNCLICTSANTCTKCSSGYTPTSDPATGGVSCLQCIASCRNCAPGKPNICVSCGDGAYLEGTECKLCSSNCKTCTSAYCTECINGYKMNQDKTCTLNCQIPCATCGKNPKVCTSCLLGYQFNAFLGKCIPQLTCSGACQFCPYGYVLSNGACVTCTGLGCGSCDSSNPTKCTSCVNGYYHDSSAGSCIACSSQCSSCISATACSSCANGYASNGIITPDGGIVCQACSSECSTCSGSIYKCTSCANGFTFEGWKCVKKQRFVFGCRLFGLLSFFFTMIFVFMRALVFGFGLGLIGFSRIAFTSIRQGSVIIDGSISPTVDQGSSTFNNQLNSVSSALTQGNTIAGFKVQSSSLALSQPVVASVNDSLGLILGICIPIGILIIVAIILVIYKVNSRKKMYQQQTQKQDEKVESRQGFSNSQKYDL